MKKITFFLVLISATILSYGQEENSAEVSPESPLAPKCEKGNSVYDCDDLEFDGSNNVTYHKNREDLLLEMSNLFP